VCAYIVLQLLSKFVLGFPRGKESSHPKEKHLSKITSVNAALIQEGCAEVLRGHVMLCREWDEPWSSSSRAPQEKGVLF
jgi:hypothetical protein